MKEWTVYLSPHLDDAVLSCGGLIRQQAAEGRQVLVVTIFAGRPPVDKLSSFAAETHARWRAGAEPVVERRQEDLVALDILGADVLHLDYPDAIYRSGSDGFFYLYDEDLFGSPYPLESRLTAEIISSISDALPLHRSSVYAPLGVGNHVDHQLVRGAVLSLIGVPARVVFYEDYPYSEKPGALTSALEGLGGHVWCPELIPLDEECVQAKIEAISTYRSQMTSLFGSEEEMRLRVRDYALALSPTERLAERYWCARGEGPESAPPGH